MKRIKFHPSFLKFHYFILLFSIFFNTQIYAGEKATLFYNKESSSVKFAVDEVSDALKKYNIITLSQSISLVDQLNKKLFERYRSNV